MSALIKAELAATCNTLGHLHKDKYIIDAQCYESVRDLIRFLRRDDESHEIRRYLGDAKIVQSDLIYIIQNCEINQNELFDIVVRLLVNLTNPVILLYKEELPSEKIGRNIYLTILNHLQEYKIAFTNIEAWNKISSKLSDLFEIDWSERSEDEGLQIERILVLIRNVLQIPSDVENEKRVDNDISVHDQVLWGLRQSQILELLLYISSNRHEDQYFIHILEILSLILREQNPDLLAVSSMNRSEMEKTRDTEDLERIRHSERHFNQKNLIRHSNFGGTFVFQNVKSISDKNLIYHRPLHKVNDLSADKKRLKTPKNRVPEESERTERRSTFSVRLFLKELCVEFLSSSYNQLMAIVKEKLVSGKALANDESYYFWALKFFMAFNRCSNLDVKHVSETMNIQTFHYVQTQMENCIDHIMTDKKKISLWVKRFHIILKAYREMIQTICWMDQSKEKHIKSMGEVLKCKLFYVVEYRELIFYCLLKYDPTKYSKKYLKDLLETSYLFFKQFKRFCETRNNKVVVQNKKTVRKVKPKQVSIEEKWTSVREAVISALNENQFPEISPFEPGKEENEQKIDAMRKVQKCLKDGNIIEGIALLRSARQVWPENNSFGYDGMPVEEEVAGIEDIYMSNLGLNYEDEEEEEEEDQDVEYKEENLNYIDFIKRVANKKVVEACAVLLEDYKKNAASTNNIIIKLLHKIAYECHMPSMLYQASLFNTFFKILKENRKEHREIHRFIVHIMKKFRENAEKNPMIYMELLFWKDARIAFDVENGYGTSSKSKASGWSIEEENELKKLWMEYDETNPENSDKIDWVMSNLINAERTRRAVTKKLRELMLMPSGPIKLKTRPPKEWTSEEKAELTELFHQFEGAVDVVGIIMDRLTVKRPKKRVVDMILELGLVHSRAQLRKNRKACSNARSALESESESDSENESDKEEAEIVSTSEVFSLKDQREALHKIYDLGMVEAINWLSETFEECLEDYDPSDDGYPLLAIEASQVSALENEDFIGMLTKLGLTSPSSQQMYWRIPGSFTKQHIEIIRDLLRRITSGERLENDEEEGNLDEFDKLRTMLQKGKSALNKGDLSLQNNTNLQLTEQSDTQRHMTSDSNDSEVEDEREKAKSFTNIIGSDSEKSDSDDDKKSTSNHQKFRIQKPVRNKKLIGSDSENSNASSLGEARRHITKARNCIGSDSEDDYEMETSKRTRINSDSENECERVRKFTNDIKRRRILMDSDSEDEGEPDK